MREIDWKIVADTLVDKVNRKIDRLDEFQNDNTKSLMRELISLELDLAIALYKGLGAK